MAELLDEMEELNKNATDLDMTLLDRNIDKMMPELGFSSEDNDQLVAAYRYNGSCFSIGGLLLFFGERQGQGRCLFSSSCKLMLSVFSCCFRFSLVAIRRCCSLPSLLSIAWEQAFACSACMCGGKGGGRLVVLMGAPADMVESARCQLLAWCSPVARSTMQTLTHISTATTYKQSSSTCTLCLSLNPWHLQQGWPGGACRDLVKICKCGASPAPRHLLSAARMCCSAQGMSVACVVADLVLC